MFRKSTFVLFSLGLAVAGSASAALLTLPDSSTLGSTFSADVSEQATCTVPGTIHFAVSDITVSTNSSGQTVDCTDVVLADGKSLKISLKANGTGIFTGPTGATVVYTDGDVHWAAGGWSSGGVVGDLNHTTFEELATGTANAATLSNTTLVFSLDPEAVDRAGSYTLAATWKFESI